MEPATIHARCRFLNEAEQQLKRIAHLERIPARVVEHAVHRLRWRLLHRLKNAGAIDLEIEPIVEDSLRDELRLPRRRVLRLSVSSHATKPTALFQRHTFGRTEVFAKVGLALAAVTSMQFHVLRLLDAGFTFPEIALCLDVSESRARSSAKSARRILRAIFRTPFRSLLKKEESA